MIKEDFVSFEVAKLLKEKGFNVSDCRNSPDYAYDKKGVFSHPLWDTEYPAPTLQMAMKWLRVVKNIQIEIPTVGEENKDNVVEKWVYGWRVQTTTIIDRHQATFTSYEEAVNDAILYTLQNLI